MAVYAFRLIGFKFHGNGVKIVLGPLGMGFFMGC